MLRHTRFNHLAYAHLRKNNPQNQQSPHGLDDRLDHLRPDHRFHAAKDRVKNNA